VALALATAAGGARAQDVDAVQSMVRAFDEVARALPAQQRTGDDTLRLIRPLERLAPIALWRDGAPLAAVNRARGRDLSDASRSSAAVTSELKTLREWWHDGSGRERARAALAPDRFETADAAVENFSDALLDQAMARVQARLDRFEVKYGEGAPKLNVVEVLLNYGLQSWKPFRPNDAGPSPNEIVLAYSTSYGTVTEDEAKAVSVLEVGARRFNLDWRPGGAGLAALLRPRYLSMGVAFAEARDGALRWPLNAAGKRTRVGPFLSLGDLKVAYLMGTEYRFVFTRQLQLLPSLF
jgi:hypothetical protein